MNFFFESLISIPEYIPPPSIRDTISLYSIDDLLAQPVSQKDRKDLNKIYEFVDVFAKRNCIVTVNKKQKKPDSNDKSSIQMPSARQNAFFQQIHPSDVQKQHEDNIFDYRLHMKLARGEQIFKVEQLKRKTKKRPAGKQCECCSKQVMKNHKCQHTLCGLKCGKVIKPNENKKQGESSVKSDSNWSQSINKEQKNQKPEQQIKSIKKLTRKKPNLELDPPPSYLLMQIDKLLQVSMNSFTYKFVKIDQLQSQSQQQSSKNCLYQNDQQIQNFIQKEIYEDNDDSLIQPGNYQSKINFPQNQNIKNSNNFCQTQNIPLNTNSHNQKTKNQQKEKHQLSKKDINKESNSDSKKLTSNSPKYKKQAGSQIQSKSELDFSEKLNRKSSQKKNQSKSQQTQNIKPNKISNTARLQKSKFMKIPNSQSSKSQSDLIQFQKLPNIELSLSSNSEQSKQKKQESQEIESQEDLDQQIKSIVRPVSNQVSNFSNKQSLHQTEPNKKQIKRLKIIEKRILMPKQIDSFSRQRRLQNKQKQKGINNEKIDQEIQKIKKANVHSMISFPFRLNASQTAQNAHYLKRKAPDISTIIENMKKQAQYDLYRKGLGQGKAFGRGLGVLEEAEFLQKQIEQNSFQLELKKAKANPQKKVKKQCFKQKSESQFSAQKSSIMSERQLPDKFDELIGQQQCGKLNLPSTMTASKSFDQEIKQEAFLHKRYLQKRQSLAIDNEKQFQKSQYDLQDDNQAEQITPGQSSEIELGCKQRDNPDNQEIYQILDLKGQDQKLDEDI